MAEHRQHQDPARPLLGTYVYPPEKGVLLSTETGPKMCQVALFAMARGWKPMSDASRRGRLMMWFTHTTAY